MKSAMKWFLIVFMLGIMVVLAACNKKGKDEETSASSGEEGNLATYTVTFYEGDTVLKQEKVEAGKTVAEFTPEKEGYEFIGWYGTPTFKFNYDFATVIESDTSIFSNWKSTEFTEDEREWMIAGESSMVGAPLNKNNWGKLSGEDRTPYMLTREEGTNKFSITLDLYAGDKFQIANVLEDYSWNGQRGYGYVTNAPEGYIAVNASAYQEGDNEANISVEQNGNFIIVLETDVDNSTLDTIKITHNGDVQVALEKSYLPNLSGTITGGNAITEAANLGDFGLVLNEENGLYETNISLNQGDYFSVLLNLNYWDNVLRTAQVDAANSDPCYNTEDLANVTVTKSAKYYIGVKLDDSTETVTGNIIIKEVGEFERYDKDNEVKFHYGKNEIITAYVRNGARVPNPGNPKGLADQVFVGWYSDLENNIPQSFSSMLDQESAIINLTPKYMGAKEEDSRDIYVKGTLNGWAGNDPAYKLERTDKHIYTITIEAHKDDQIMFTFYEGDRDTGTFAVGSIVDYDNSTDKVSGSDNILISEDGSYTITFDTYDNVITIK